MNYFKEKNREKFIQYWNGEMEKKLFRCSKEFGFYKNLKKTIGSNCGTFQAEFYKRSLAELVTELDRNKKDIVNFADILDEVNRQYPVHTALHSRIHLSHLFSFLILQKCKISHEKLVDGFKWMTTEIFDDNKSASRLLEIKSYVKLFFS